MIIWLASYPKSGNTLLRSMLASYFYSKEGILNFNDTYKIQQFPAIQHFKNLNLDLTNEKEIYENFIEAQRFINIDKKIKFMKTHSSLARINNCNFTDLNNSLGAIYIVRDPRNVVTSFAHHYNLGVDETIKVMTDPKRWLVKTDLIYKTFLGSWSINYNSWKQMKSRILIIKYEDLANKKKTTLLKIFNFIKKIGFPDFEVDMLKLNKVIKTSEFKNMQVLEKKEDFKEAVIDPKSKTRKVFFKFGPKNDWKKILNKEFKEKIEKAFSKEMEELGYV